MPVRNAASEDMARAGHIMAVSFRTAFADFVTKETMDACAQEENCAAMLEGIFREGKVRFLMGEDSGMLAWQRTEEGAEIIAVHSLPSSWGTGLGAAMLEEALRQIGNQRVFLWAFRKIPGPAASTKNTASAGTGRSGSASSTGPWKCGM